MTEKLIMLGNNGLDLDTRLWSIFVAISFPDPSLLI